MKLTRLFLFVSVVAMQTAWSKPFCTAKDVEGTYAFQADGTILVPLTPITGPFMRIGYFTADGVKNVKAFTLAVYNGINFGFEVYSGTYTVTTDCTIEFHLGIPAPIGAPAVFKGRVADGGDDIMFMLMSTENVFAPAITTVLGHGRRRKIDRCTVKDLNGAYRVEVNGWFGLSLATPTQQRMLGRVLTNGAGSLSASFIKSTGGTITEETTNTGTYSVGQDCTFTMNLPGSSTVLIGSLINKDGEAFVALNPPPAVSTNFPPFGPVTINGVVATGTMLEMDSDKHND